MKLNLVLMKMKVKNTKQFFQLIKKNLNYLEKKQKKKMQFMIKHMKKI